ncbi:hypothetical protein D0T23_07280 [Duganella sp. BJB475]|nr:hypothetical protein D0T23_07280 [Duganella sp. BJB475]RFP36142.1 hypothetical protein D0T21_06825 [Duganella sp. BJB476]
MWRGLTQEEARAALEKRFLEGLEKQARRAPKTVRVRRGLNENTLAKSPRFYGFLQNIEGAPMNERTLQDPHSYWYLQFECVNADWVDARVAEMQRDRRFEWVIQFLQGRAFNDAWAASTHPGRYALSAVHQQFAADLVKMNPEEGIYECLVDPGYLRQAKIDSPKEAQWFELILVGRPDDPDEETHGFFFFDDAAEDGTARLAQAQLGWLRRMTPGTHEFLTAINFPNFEPPEAGDPAIEVNLDAPEEPPEVDMEDAQPGSGMSEMFQGPYAIKSLENRAPFCRALKGAWDGAREWLREKSSSRIRLWEAVQMQPHVGVVREWLAAATAELRSLTAGLQPYGAAAGPGGLRLPVADRRERCAAPLAYGGHPGPNTMAAAGGHRPFVGVVNVGQGGLNMISGSDGRIVAYFDFGWTINNAFAPTVLGVETLPDLCFCDRPTIIISSMDSDHVNMISKMPDSRGLRWILPQELSSTRATKRIAKITAAGGIAYLFPRGGARRHLRFPWGFVERCNGDASNRGGLAAFVCVEDGGMVGAAAPGAAIAASGSISAVCNRGRAAVAAVAALPAPVLNAVQIAVLNAVCAALGLCRHANTMNPLGNLFAAAVRAAVVHAVANPLAGQVALTGMLALAPFNILAAAPRAATRIATGHAIHNAVNAVAVAGVVSLARARSNAAAAAFDALRAAGVEPAEWEALVWTAQHPAWGAGTAPQLLAGVPPYHANERFVMLCGDAFCWDVPSLNDIPPPAVVGMQAGHHGSIQSDGGYLTTDAMPWAPGSPHSAAAQAAAGAADVVNQAALAGNSLNPGTPVGTLTALAAPAVTAVVNGLLDTYGVAAHAMQLDANQGLRMRAAFTAAAAVISHTALASYRRRGAGAILAGWAHPDACNPGSFLQAVTVPLGHDAAITAAELAATGLLHENSCVHAQAILSGLPAVVADNIAEATATAASLMDPGRFDDTLCVTTVTNCLTRRHAADAPVDPGQHAAAILAGFTGYPATRADTLRLAALHTAAGVVAHHLNVSAEIIVAAMEPMNTRAAAVAGALAAAAGGGAVNLGQIAYSYGVTRVAPYKHGYASTSAQFGRVGHAHPAAVRLYESHGWRHRFNTSQNAHLNAVQGDPASPRGNVALCWDAANHTRYAGHYTGAPGATHIRACPTCNKQMTFNY